VIVEIESELPSVVPVQPDLEVGADVEHAELSALESTLASKTMPREKKPVPAEAVKAVEFKEIGSFKDLRVDEVRRAIVLNEILGPPLALRDYDRPWER
ncbi:MAG: hypothetical protein JSV03_07410, partial [Planctomycetota bacterium]